MQYSKHYGRGRSGETLAMAVVEAVSEREGVPVNDLNPLYDVVDPEALEAIFAPLADGTPRPGGRVRFTYAGYEIEVSSDGRVQLDPEEPRR